MHRVRHHYSVVQEQASAALNSSGLFSCTRCTPSIPGLGSIATLTGIASGPEDAKEEPIRPTAQIALGPNVRLRLQATPQGYRRDTVVRRDQPCGARVAHWLQASTPHFVFPS